LLCKRPFFLSLWQRPRQPARLLSSDIPSPRRISPPDIELLQIQKPSRRRPSPRTVTPDKAWPACAGIRVAERMNRILRNNLFTKRNCLYIKKANDPTAVAGAKQAPFSQDYLKNERRFFCEDNFHVCGQTLTMYNSSKKNIIDGDRIFKATNVKKIHPVFLALAESLSDVSMLRFIKIYNDRLCASNLLSDDGRKDPLVDADRKDLVGIEVLVDPAFKTIQFFSIVSFKKGNGRKMAAAVSNATPDDWLLAVAMDWSGGFWDTMKKEHPKIAVFKRCSE
jgi:hypothetical protein